MDNFQGARPRDLSTDLVEISFFLRHGALLVGIRLYQACICRQVIATGYALRNASDDDFLEDLPEKVAISEAPVTVLEVCRMIRSRVRQVEATATSVARFKCTSSQSLRSDRISWV